ncbi:MAG TPA: ABC transporter permease [Steroidobacteraceae bacterium]|nr:ABC transporter permease [Steroidobacteraceae bacterium]
MNLAVSLKTALRNLRRATLRSALTALGIIIGVAAVIAVVSVGNGARANVEKTLSNLESNQLEISGDPKPGQWRRGLRWGLPAGDGLRLADYDAIRRDIRGLSATTVRLYGYLNRAAPTNQPRANAYGVDVQGLRVLGRVLIAGTTFGENDVRTAASVCVIPKYLAEAIFGTTDVVGRIVQIADTPFTVIGVMEDEARFRERQQGEPGDITAFVPYTSFLSRLDREAKITIVLRAEDPKELSRIQLEVSDLLERRRGDRVADFVTGNISEVVRRQTDASQTLTILLGSIGGISLLVGGIGIMNIMLVSVTERTREIGIRLALGTRTRDVMGQFVMEAVTLSACGGLIGVLGGVGVAHAIAYVSNWPTLITPSSIIAALLCSAVIGVFFGFYPAKRAAELDPIQALRAE